MKKHIIILKLVLIHAGIINAYSASHDIRQHLLMDYNWKFIQSDVKDAEKPELDDSGWRTLNVPHDWSIEGEFKEDAVATGLGGYLPTGVGWYRKQFNLSDIRKLLTMEILWKKHKCKAKSTMPSPVWRWLSSNQPDQAEISV
jgi:hypothetical protein